jgi:hypothetical protein
LSRRNLLIGYGLATVAIVLLCKKIMSIEPSFSISCSSDGKVIVHNALDGNGGLVVMKQGRSTTLRIGGDVQAISVNSAGTQALVSMSSDGKNYGISSVDLVNGQLRPLTKPVDASDFSPIWLTDHVVLFWRSTRRSGDLFGGSNAAGFEVCAFNAVSEKNVELTNGDYFDVSPLVSLGSGQVIFEASGRLYRLKYPAGKTLEITGLKGYTPACPGPKPDTFIAVGAANNDFAYDLFLLDVRSQTASLITKEGIYIESACFARTSGEIHYIIDSGRAALRTVRVPGP